MPDQIVDFPENYRQTCFYEWYKAGRPENIVKVVPYAPDGRRPTKSTLDRWRSIDGWDAHADAMDAELSRALDIEAIKERAKLVKQLAQDARLVKSIALNYLKGEEPFKDNPSAAVRAFVAATDMEFKYSGMAQTLVAIASMNDKQLEKEMYRLLGKNENEITVDAEDTSGDSNPEDDNS